MARGRRRIVRRRAVTMRLIWYVSAPRIRQVSLREIHSDDGASVALGSRVAVDMALGSDLAKLAWLGKRKNLPILTSTRKADEEQLEAYAMLLNQEREAFPVLFPRHPVQWGCRLRAIKGLAP